MKKKLPLFLAFIMLFSICCFNVSALDRGSNDSDYEYKTYDISRYVYDKDDNFLGIVRFQFKFRYSRDSVTAKCMCVNNTVVSESSNAKLKISHEIQNLTLDKGGAFGKLEVLKPNDVSGESARFFVTVDHNGKLEFYKQCSDNIKVK